MSTGPVEDSFDSGVTSLGLFEHPLVLSVDLLDLLGSGVLSKSLLKDSLESGVTSLGLLGDPRGSEVLSLSLCVSLDLGVESLGPTDECLDL